MVAFDLFAITLGLILGSFLLTLAMRMQSGSSIWPRSRCDSCAETIGIIGLIPVVGYLIQRGKCLRCGAGISPVYPAFEMANAVGVWLVFNKTGPDAAFVHMLLIFEVLLLIAVIDYGSHLIFSQPVLIGLVIQSIWLVFFARAELLDALFGLFLGAGIFHWVSYLYFLVRKREGLGAGDATLLGLIGFIFGWQALFSIIFWASALGIAGGSLLLISRRQSLKREIAFGPWLVLSAFLVWRFADVLRELPLHISNINLSIL